MVGRTESSESMNPPAERQGRRVVILTRDSLFCAPPAGQAVAYEMIRVPTAYEAAAEIMAAPAMALVIDLRAMSMRHARLVEIARRMDVEILATGVLPAGMDSEVFSGIRLVAALDRLAAAVPAIPAKTAEEPSAPVSQSTLHPHVPSAQTSSGQAAPAKLTPAKKESAPRSRPEEPVSPGHDHGQKSPPELGQFLTSEEISALLEDGL